MKLSAPRANPLFPWRVFLRFVVIYGTLLVLALLASALAARYFFEKQFKSEIAEQLRETIGVLTKDVRGDIPPDWCSVHAAGTTLRFTMITFEGQVVCDSHHDPHSMENHAARPEIVEARKGGF